MKFAICSLLVFIAISPILCDEARSSHEKVAQELLEALDCRARWQEIGRTIFDVQVKVNPTLAPFREVFERFAAEYMTWEIVEPRFIQIYMETFTEREMREVIAFSRTPTGHKWWTETPGLMQRSSFIGVEIVQGHKAEIDAMVKERQRQLDDEKKKP